MEKIEPLRREVMREPKTVMGIWDSNSLSMRLGDIQAWSNEASEFEIKALPADYLSCRYGTRIDLERVMDAH